jgi:hypothetical protein
MEPTARVRSNRAASLLLSGSLVTSHFCKHRPSVCRLPVRGARHHEPGFFHFQLKRALCSVENPNLPSSYVAGFGNYWPLGYIPFRAAFLVRLTPQLAQSTLSETAGRRKRGPRETTTEECPYQ